MQSRSGHGVLKRASTISTAPLSESRAFDLRHHRAHARLPLASCSCVEGLRSDESCCAETVMEGSFACRHANTNIAMFACIPSISTHMSCRRPTAPCSEPRKRCAVLPLEAAAWHDGRALRSDCHCRLALGRPGSLQRVVVRPLSDGSTRQIADHRARPLHGDGASRTN
jgi:hypothetical protein